MRFITVDAATAVYVRATVSEKMTRARVVNECGSRRTGTGIRVYDKIILYIIYLYIYTISPITGLPRANTRLLRYNNNLRVYLYNIIYNNNNIIIIPDADGAYIAARTDGRYSWTMVMVSLITCVCEKNYIQ